MSNHFFGVARGTDGFKPVEIIRGTSSTATTDVELRVADVDQQSVALTRKDVLLMIDALERLFQTPGSSPDGTTFPPL